MPTFRKVKTALFHNSVAPLPGMPDVQNTAGGNKTPGVAIEISESPEGILLRKGTALAFVPMVNIKNLIFENEQNTEVKPK